jgi:hypothetical protein
MKVELIKYEMVDTEKYKTRREQNAEAQRIIYRLSALERVRKHLELNEVKRMLLAKTKKNGKYIAPKPIKQKK